MARTNDAQTTLRVLAKHGEAILEAHLTRGNRIPETGDNQNLVDTLEHHRLAWRIGDDEDPQFKKVLVHFLSHITESERRRWASEQVDRLWSELTDLFDQYRKAKTNVSLADQERLEGEIKEVLAEIIEDIRNATEAFSAYINSGFSYITDLELRIRQNEKVIAHAGRLNALFDSFNIQELAEQAGTDLFLKRILLKYLPATLEEGRRNLSFALNQLRIMLVRLREDQRLNKLVGSFEVHYQRNPGYIPSIDHLDVEACPPVLNSVAPFLLKASPDIYEPIDDQELIALAAAARNKSVDPPRDEVIPDNVESVDFDVDGEVDEDPADPVEIAIEQLIQFILDGDIGQGEIVATEALAVSRLEIDRSTWLATLVAEIDALSVEDQSLIEVEYSSRPDPMFADNLYIHDLTLRHAHEG